MSKNFVQPGETLTLTAPYARDSGQGALVGAIFGVAAVDVASGAQASFHTQGIWDLTKTAAQAWATVGLKIYWDDTNKECTTSDSGNTLIGVNVATAANPSATGRVRLNGVF